MLNQIDGKLLRKMIISASNNLENNIEIINELNVFPVPDGDTGTNMSLTFGLAVSEVKLSNSNSVSEIADILATASLRSARGNSGVILSQIFRGFAKGLKGKVFINAKQLAIGLQEGVNTAYKAGMKPIEGTILTVAKESAKAAFEISETKDDIIQVFESTVDRAKESLKETTEMLPALKQAGVVDAGGKGLVCILEGMLYFLKNNRGISLTNLKKNINDKTYKNPNTQEHLLERGKDIRFVYCTEFLICNFNKFINIKKFENNIKRYGDNIFIVEDNNIIKLHMHTNNPGIIIEEALKIGELTDIKIDNMKDQYDKSFLNKKEEKEKIKNKKYGFVVVAIGLGLINIFKDLGADHVIAGGQSMNPSTEDILNAINLIHADNIFVLCNNKNIIAAAEQVINLTDKNIIIIPTKSIPQGISSMITFNPELTPDENKMKMVEALNEVKTGQITYAVRDSIIDDKQIKKGDILGINDDKITVINSDIEYVCYKLLEDMVDDECSIISIYFGKDIEETNAKKVMKEIEKKFPDYDIEIHDGGQPLYYYIISIE